MTADDSRFKAHSRQRLHAVAAITFALLGALSGCAAPLIQTPVGEPRAAVPFGARWHASSTEPVELAFEP